MKTNDNKAGNRWQEFLSICEAVTENEQLFESNETDFAESMVSRLTQYEYNAFITVPQINFIHRLDEKAQLLGLVGVH
jgi:hypothetical protein